MTICGKYKTKYGHSNIKFLNLICCIVFCCCIYKDVFPIFFSRILSSLFRVGLPVNTLLCLLIGMLIDQFHSRRYKQESLKTCTCLSAFDWSMTHEYKSHAPGHWLVMNITGDHSVLYYMGVNPVLAKGKQWLLLTRHPPCYSYS
jgi:hypothetical protein